MIITLKLLKMSIVDLSENRLHILHESDLDMLEHSKVQEIKKENTLLTITLGIILIASAAYFAVDNYKRKFKREEELFGSFKYKLI
ncbi:MAG: hypothetical protein DA407_09270 [Bacteroidetes bacterium]|nr:MAG: hypothetical protein DA407_09270 [Bacteroidota bacterium]